MRISLNAPTCVVGLDHLLQVEGEDHPSETKMACFMGLLSQLAAKPEVLRVSALHRAEYLGSVTNALIQSASTNETNLFTFGLDGAGEVIQASHLERYVLLQYSKNFVESTFLPKGYSFLPLKPFSQISWQKNRLLLPIIRLEISVVGKKGNNNS